MQKLIDLLLWFEEAAISTLKRRAYTSTLYRGEHLALAQAIRIRDRQHIEEVLQDSVYFNGAFERALFCLDIPFEDKDKLIKIYEEVITNA